jgi:hypothetical protein
MRRGGLRQEEARLGRHPERSVPVLLGHFFYRLRLETGAGRVHEEVDTAQLGDRALDERPRLGHLGEVAGGAPWRQHG